MKIFAQNGNGNIWNSSNSQTIIFPSQTQAAKVGIGLTTPVQRLHIHQPTPNVCTSPFSPPNFGIQQADVNAKKPPVNANAAHANGKPALQAAMTSFQNAVNNLQAQAQNFQTASTPTAQQTCMCALPGVCDSLTYAANALDIAQAGAGNAGGLANLNLALDSLQAAAQKLRTAVENAAAARVAPNPFPCNNPTLYEAYTYFTTQETGSELNRGVRIGIFDKIGMLNNYSGAWYMTAQASPNLTSISSTARLQPPNGTDTYAGYFELAFPDNRTLRGGYRQVNGRPAAYWNAPAILQLNPMSGALVETGGAALIGTDLTTKGAVYAGAGPGLKVWHEGAGGNARIDVQGSGDIVFNYESNRNVFIGSQNFGAPYANLSVAGSINALKGDLEAANGSVNVKNNLTGNKLQTRYAQLDGNGSGNDIVLAANGTICAREVRVSDIDPCAVPDYVFSSTYPLPTLAELKAYIDTHHHLPGIPADAEIATTGINLAHFQLKLLQKLEEQTLYILQLKKEIEEMKGEGR